MTDSNTTTNNTGYIRFVIALALLFTIYPAYADIALPTILFTLPGMLIALIPVIAFETSISSRMLSRSFLSILKTVSISNIITTFVGIPLSSAFHFLMFWIIGGFRPHSATIDTAISLIGPGAIIAEYKYTDPWLEFLAIIIVFLVACIVSIIIEWVVYVKMLHGYTKRTLLNACILSNIGSYIVLLLGVFVYLYHLKKIPGAM